jgi:hypothetical protein
MALNIKAYEQTTQWSKEKGKQKWFTKYLTENKRSSNIDLTYSLG